MKKTSLLTIFTIMVLLFVNCNSKKEYTIKGDIGDFAKKYDIDSIFIYDRNNNPIKGAAVGEDGKFEIKGTVENKAQRCVIGNGPKKLGSEFILENAFITYTITPDERAQIKGGKIHETVMDYLNDPKYVALVNDYTKKADEQLDNVNMTDEVALTKARRIVDEAAYKVLDLENGFNNRIVEGDYSTVTKLMALVVNKDWQKYSLEKRKELLLEYKKELGDHPDITDYWDYLTKSEDMLAAADSVTNGNYYSSFTGKDRDGKDVDLSIKVLSNKYTMLEFWASWCGPCRGEIPNIKKAYKKYKDKGFDVFSVSIDANKEDWFKALNEEKMPWTNVRIEGGFSNDVIKTYGIWGVPASYLIDSEGKVVANNEELREFDLDRTLSRLFNEKEKK